MLHQALSSMTMTTKNPWNQRFGHINLHDLLLLHKQGMVDEIPILRNEHIDCEGCALGKIHRDEFPFSLNRRNKDILELVHIDICGPTQTRSLGGDHYFL